jgi:nicotinamidase-related amidase
MLAVGNGPEIDKSALIMVDMQNDFLHSSLGAATARIVWRGRASRSQHRYVVSDRTIRCG